VTNSGGYTVEVRGLTTRIGTLDDSFLEEWSALYARQTGLANPFSHPVWVKTWLEYFVSPKDIFLHTVRTVGGELVGVAPFYRQQMKLGPVKIAKRLLFVGMGHSGATFEIPGLLAAPGLTREVTRAVVQSTTEFEGVDWFEVSLDSRVSWLENDWLGGSSNAYEIHRMIRACVVLPLEESWEAQLRALKRNVKESLRRSRNRLAKDGRPWKVVRLTDQGLDEAAVTRLLHLHNQRAESNRSTSDHHDVYADPQVRAFTMEVLPALGRTGAASIYELHIDGSHIASQLVLHAPGCLYFHSSGFDPSEWHLGPITFLQGEAIQDAILEGNKWVNFSPGPNVAKMRWSEQLHVYDDFVYCLGGRSSRFREAAQGQYAAWTLRRRSKEAAAKRRAEPSR
jgi:CelD/BcsL family acetyltransferase involved in cellulose biosynthesis